MGCLHKFVTSFCVGIVTCLSQECEKCGLVVGNDVMHSRLGDPVAWHMCVAAIVSMCILD